ncbi:uncharacterized protein LOC110020180 [Phalaenopsis equestris]|uniref:uncharacterized protein LOC110020180 n=1 Tax=Phalaenopsis equestris TaxID=78828 RepID=UPI0009E27B6E|nr:uncharacterized protein LOC110020180 [Phalaenopsis equestris]
MHLPYPAIQSPSNHGQSLTPARFRSTWSLNKKTASSDRSISRYQVSLQYLDTRADNLDTNNHAEEPLLSFEVVGKNPILVCSGDGEGKRIYRKAEKGVLKAGDRISLSIKNPNFFFVRRREGRKGEVESSVLDALARRERRTQLRRKEEEEREKLEEVGGKNEMVWEDSGLEIGSLDISKIDPVKEFGFLVRGHEFDHYPRRKIRPFTRWSWFLEDPRCVTDEDDDEDALRTSLKVKHRKKKKGGDENDEDWAEENEDLSIFAAKHGSSKRPSYSTRSKEPKKPHTNIRDGNKSLKKGFKDEQEELVNEDDETLGGFIVSDDDIEDEEEGEVLGEETEEEEEINDEEPDFD